MSVCITTRLPVESPQSRWARRAGLLLLVLTGALVPASAAVIVRSVPEPEDRASFGWFVLALVFSGVAVQAYWSAYRAWGIAVYGTVLYLAAVGHGSYWNEWPGWLHGVALGLVLGGLVRAARYYHRGSWPELLLLAVAAGLLVSGLLSVGCVLVAPESTGALFLLRLPPFSLLIGVSLMMAIAVGGLFRPALALSCEPLVWLMYAIRWRGGDERQVPAHGPCLVIANHACWMDPFFLEKVLPRPTTPMMTSRFYDLPVLRWLMRHFGVIRVPEQSIKKEAPELQEAIAALDRGECVVIFPEGYLRRREECPLRRFGRGVWVILQARPTVPVFACWIEGNWGSFTSFWQGPPTKNKRLDWRRPIAVAVTGPHLVPAAVLADHWQTRYYLMNLVGAARGLLGLAPLPPFQPSPTESTVSQLADDVED
ncbi:MAG: 1-acyl-sn-glycerol-3-phosphate acyltransferase [Gemmataceae bacterium]|nr:1-acyl-sn-glycerol-3-phosphate acyltransferase [Gemmataceae bacterium]MCS7269981.1 1-acyl-sn-glycerol-3-phosphate acyltransferase [Gemmataceae bacterium]MDW8242975.1 lysophospholipid acyltransferase family protein [Thermogemmata sp.]